MTACSLLLKQSMDAVCQQSMDAGLNKKASPCSHSKCKNFSCFPEGTSQHMCHKTFSKTTSLLAQMMQCDFNKCS